MDWRSLPPLSALRAFAAYAQTGSVEQAGALLNVSHAAISQQLRALESHTGLALLDRSGRSMVLTETGQALARAVEDGFGQIGQAVNALTGAEAVRPLHVTTTPSFASYWLMPRLAGFRAEAPGVDLMLNPTPQLADPAPGDIDVAIRYGDGNWPGFESEMLVPSPIVVVGAPSLVEDVARLSPSDLTRYPWLQELGSNEASRWLQKKGVQDAPPAGVVSVPGNLMIDGARAGQGVAVTTFVAVADDVAAGRLNILFQEEDTNGYHIVTIPGVPRPPLRAFLRWLRREGRK